MFKKTMVKACCVGAALAVTSFGAWAQDSTDNGSMPPPPPGQGGGPRHGFPKFEDFDVNSDGSLTIDEFVAASAKKQSEHFTRMDSNGDGKLSKDELSKSGPPGGGPGGPGGPPPQDNSSSSGSSSDSKSMQGPPPGGGPRPPKLEDLDADSDGSVSKEEFQTVMSKHDKERFSKLDANSDGKVTKEEFASNQGPKRR
jgi:hypothetical protein